MKRRFGFVLLIGLAMIVSACGPNPEVFVIRGTRIDGFLTVVSRERIEFEGRLKGDLGTPFWLFSQEEGVGEGTPNWTPMTCSVPTLETTGYATVKCFVTVDKKHRQNAIQLSTTSDPQSGRVERIEYRPNVIDNEAERFGDLDFRLSQRGIAPTDIKNTLAIYDEFNLSMEVNADYNRWPPRYDDPFAERYAPSRGFYLTFITTTEGLCGEKFVGNHVNLYHWNGSEWMLVQSIRVEDVDFHFETGVHDFDVEGTTVRLRYTRDNDCGSYRSIEIL